MTMRVAIVNPVWAPSTMTPEETLRQFPTLTGWARAVASAGAAVTVHQRFPSSSTLEHAGVPCAFVRDGSGPKPDGVWSSAGEMGASVRAADPDLVHVNGVIFPQWLRALRRALPARIRMVAQDHGGWHPDTASLWSRRRVRRGLSAVDAVLVSSPGQVEMWRSTGVVPSGVGLADVMEASTDMRAIPKHEAIAVSGVTGDPAILWVGRLTPNKDPLTMIEGFSLFMDAWPNAVLSLVYNGGTMLRAVRDRIDRDPRLAARVALLGSVPTNQMAAHYSAADIYVSASHHEGSGYAAIEAMACGAAPVLTGIPSFQVLTDGGRVGALWQAREPQSLCAALTRTAASLRAPLRARVLAQFASAVSWEVLGRRAVEVYRGVCAR